jgi:SCP-2 sterol transfer family
MEMKQQSRAKQWFLYAAPFPALGFFKVWAASGRAGESLAIASFAMLAYCAVIVAIAYRWDKPTYLDWAVLAYFTLITGALMFRPERAALFLERFAVTGIYACLFAAAFFPPLAGMAPFTYHYAKRSSPPEVWDNPIFMRINRIMTGVWSGIFLINLLLSLYPSVITRVVIPLGLILGFGIPFNLRFPDAYLKRLGLPSRAEMAAGALPQGDRRSAAARGMPLPHSAWEAISRMPKAFDKASAGDLSAVIGFVVSGSENFEAYVLIYRGLCTLEQHPPRRPDLLIRTPAEVWLGISRKERDGQAAFNQGAFTAEGNLGLLLRMNSLFSGQPSEVISGSRPE